MLRRHEVQVHSSVITESYSGFSLFAPARMSAFRLLRFFLDVTSKIGNACPVLMTGGSLVGVAGYLNFGTTII